MTDTAPKKEYLKITSGQMEQPFEWSVGRPGSRFLAELRDNKRIMGLKCPKCGIVYATPRIVCRTCFVELTDWVPLSNKGTLMTFTVLTFGFVDPSTGIERPVPYTAIFVKPDGADTAIGHFLDETDMSKIKIGMRVEAVYEENRVGSLLDIKHFTTIKEPKAKPREAKKPKPKKSVKTKVAKAKKAAAKPKKKKVVKPKAKKAKPAKPKKKPAKAKKAKPKKAAKVKAKKPKAKTAKTKKVKAKKTLKPKKSRTTKTAKAKGKKGKRPKAKKGKR